MKSDERNPKGGLADSTGYWAAVERAAVSRLPIGVLRAGGRDARRWLHKLVTADVEHLSIGQGERSALLDAKGHFLADFVVLPLQDSFLLLVDSGTSENLESNLRRYVLRDQVELSDESDLWLCITAIGPASDDWSSRTFGSAPPNDAYHYARIEEGETDTLVMRSHRANVPSTDVLLRRAREHQVEELLGPMARLQPDTLEILRVEAGLARFGIDFDRSTLALEIPPIMSIRVDQGCYVGQEVVARIVHRGHVNRLLVGLWLDKFSPNLAGQALSDGQTPVGVLTSAVLSPRAGPIALGYVRRELAEPGTHLLLPDSNSATVSESPFAPSYKTYANPRLH